VGANGSEPAGVAESRDGTLVVWDAARVPLEGLTQAVARACAMGDSVLVRRADMASWDAALGLPPLPEDWARAFAAAGFGRDLGAGDDVAAGGALYRRLTEGLPELAADYERRFSVLDQVARARRLLLVTEKDGLARALHEARGLRAELVQRDNQLAALEAEARDLRERNIWLAGQLAAIQAWRDGFQATPAWRVASALQGARGVVLPPGSRRDSVWTATAQAPAVARRDGGRAALEAVLAAARSPSRTPLVVEPVPVRPLPLRRTVEIDVVVCVHDALEDLTRCLESIQAAEPLDGRLVLVDDGSGEETASYLRAFAGEHGAVLLRNDQARGYTLAANQGLAASRAPWACLLNSDTLVGPGWLDHLAACGSSGPRIGMVGPLSNTASWQSTPRVEDAGDWAANPLPEGSTASDMARAVGEFSPRVYPAVPLLNGFCLMLRREMLDRIGAFDEAAFGAGYGEENDLAFRARKAGWELAIADDCFVYHAQSKSYSDARRRDLSERAQGVLAARHGTENIAAAVREMAHGRVMAGVRARSGLAVERRSWVDRGRVYAGKRLMFVLPISAPGGGANVVLFEAAALQRMGVEVALFNRTDNRTGFEMAYPEPGVRVIYGERSDLVREGASFDAVVATAHYSVPWLDGLPRGPGTPVRGYYIQDFEPFMHTLGSPGFQHAWDSYTVFDDLVRFTKTSWNRLQVETRAKVSCAEIGVSMDVDTFTPRPRPKPEWPGRPLRIAAMIRPESPIRGADLTMAVLEAAWREHGRRIEPWLFGSEPDNKGFMRISREFPWRNAGVIDGLRVAALLNQVDVFVDFSTYQAMGLTALEAMASGVAVVAPVEGGPSEFIRHGENGILTDTSTVDHCLGALNRLIRDDASRMAIQNQAIRDAAHFYPERAAFRMLEVLFGSAESGDA
jgi:GT2 family glycosyltransferase